MGQPSQAGMEHLNRMARSVTAAEVVEGHKRGLLDEAAKMICEVARLNPRMTPAQVDSHAIDGVSEGNELPRYVELALRAYYAGGATAEWDAFRAWRDSCVDYPAITDRRRR